jgi:outer membrane immunogenic protein
MRRIFASCLVALVMATMVGPAAAADLRGPIYQPLSQVPPPPPILRPSWEGFYLGINGGGAWGSSQWNGADRFDLWGGLIGGTVGYNWQPWYGRIVLGVEGDLDWSGLSGNTSGLCAGCEIRNHWLATLRGRVGVDFQGFLPYFTAGLAAGDIQTTVPGLPGGSSTNAGWALGGGIEYLVLAPRAPLGPAVSVKAEYLHVDLGDFSCGLNCGFDSSGNVSFHANVFRAGLNVRFAPWW